MAETRFEQAAPGRYRVTGAMTFATVNTLLAQSAGLAAHPESDLEVDLAGVERADSAGLALLIHWLRGARAADKAIRFHGIPAQLRAMAGVSDLAGVLSVDPR